MSKITLTIDLEELASGLADDLQINDKDLVYLHNGEVPEGWTNAIMDRLEHDYSLETLLTTILLRSKQ